MVKIGEVICTLELPSHRDILIQFMPDKRPKAGQFVEIRDDKSNLNFIGRMVKPHIFHPYYTDRRIVQDSLSRVGDSRMLIPLTEQLEIKTSIARVLGVLNGSEVNFTGDVPRPGSEAHEVSKEQLAKLFGFEEQGLFSGHAPMYQDMPVKLNSKIFTEEHSTTFGVTRWGKSYTNAVLVEELFKKKLPVLIIDPHGEYPSFQEPNDEPTEINVLPDGLKPMSFNTVVWSPPPFNQAGEKLLTVSFSELRPEEIIEMTKTTGENQIAVIYEAARRLEGRDYTIEQFIENMEEAREDLGISAAVESIAGRLRALQRSMEIFGEGFKPAEIIKNDQITIINLSGLDLRAQCVAVTCVLRRLFNERQYGNIPEFAVFMDEAQRFVPERGEPISKHIVEELVKEGLKFGISVHLIAQRPTEVSSTVRSEVGTKVFHKLIEAQEINYAANLLSETAPDYVDIIPTLGKGEAIIMGGCTNFIPIQTEVRPRQSRHRGRTGKMLKRKRVSDQRAAPSLQEKKIQETLSTYSEERI